MENRMCDHENAKCINSRRREGYRYRRFKCQCGYRFSSIEVNIPDNLKLNNSNNALDILNQAINKESIKNNESAICMIERALEIIKFRG
jgi:transcriptional regulator NrdR family protein